MGMWRSPSFSAARVCADTHAASAVRMSSLFHNASVSLWEQNNRTEGHRYPNHASALYIYFINAINYF